MFPFITNRLILLSFLSDVLTFLNLSLHIYNNFRNSFFKRFCDFVRCFLYFFVIMQGRVHYYEGYDMTDVVLPTRLMGMMGAKKILLTNAAGISKTELNHKEVQETADKVAKSFKELVAKVVVNM